VSKQKRNTQLLQIGYKELKGQIKNSKRFSNVVPITSITFNIKNIFIEDVNFIVAAIFKNKVLIILIIISNFF
jgi:hypothetical protein